jgi:hypothetical protein
MAAATSPQRAAAPPGGGCRGTTKAGAPCRGIAQANGWCLMHDPARRDDARAAQASGATARNKLVAIHGRRQNLDSVPALVRFTSGVVLDVVDGTLSPDIARVALYGASIQRQLLEASDLEARLRALEDAHTTEKGRQQWQR